MPRMAWATSAWARSSLCQRHVPRGPRLQQSHITYSLCMALQPLGKEGRNQVGKEGRSMEWCAEHWMRRSPWFLASLAANLLCGLL